MVYDAVIVGSGTMGVAAALSMARRGLAVLAIDRFGVPNVKTEHFGEARMFRTAYYEHPSYVPLLVRSRELWLELNEAAGRDLYHETGGVYFGRVGGEVVPGSLRSAVEHGLEHEQLTVTEAARRYPQFTPPGDAEVLVERRAGVIEPEAAVAAMARLARDVGASIGTHEEVLHIEPGDEVEVVTDRSRYTARQVVLASGGWTAKVLGESGLMGPELTVTRQPIGWFEPRVEGSGAFRLRGSEAPVWAYEDEPGSLLYGFPILPGAKDFRVARHRRGPVMDVDEIDRGVHEEDVADFERGVRGLIPGAGAVSRSAIAYYTNSTDSHFVIDRLPGASHVTIVAGFSGHGFKFAPVVGEIVADLVQRGETKHDIGLFRATREDAKGGE